MQLKLGKDQSNKIWRRELLEMTDKEIMLHRFSRKNLRKSTGELAKYLGISRQEYEAACKRAMDREAKEWQFHKMVKENEYGR